MAKKKEGEEVAKEAGPSASNPSQGRAEKEGDSSEEYSGESGDSSEVDSEDEAEARSPFGAVPPLPVSTPAPLGGATHSAVAEGQQEEEAVPHVVEEGPANSPNAAELCGIPEQNFGIRQ